MRCSRSKYPLRSKKLFFFKSVITVIYLLLNCSLLFSQGIDNLNIEKVEEDGLTNDYIVCINQDTKGFLWFGTREGLFRYDGYSFKAFKNIPGDSTSLVNNTVVCIYPENNKLWVGTLGGLSRIDINTGAVENVKAHEPLQVYAILPKNENTFWVGTSTGLFQFSKKSFQWRRTRGLERDVWVHSLWDDQKDHLYLSSNNGFYAFTRSTASWKHYHPPLPTYPKVEKGHPIAFNQSLLDKDGSLWFTTYGAGLVRFNTRTEKLTSWLHQTNDAHVVPYKITTDLLQDSLGNIWIANVDGGLTIFNPKENRFINYPVDWKSDSKLSSAVISLFRDKSGIFWIGTKSGVYKFDPFNVRLSKSILLIKKGDSLSQAYDSPGVIFKDKEGRLWAGMYEGLFLVDQKTGVLTDINKMAGMPPHLPVFTITQDSSGNIWSNAKNILVKISRKNIGKGAVFKTQTFESDGIKSNITSVFIDHLNRMWIATHAEGVFRFDPNSKKFISCNYKARDIRGKINEVRAFCEISKDSLLLVGENTGVCLFHTNTGRYEVISWPNMPALTNINTIYKKNKDIWIGSEDIGLWQTDVTLKKPTVIGANDGMPSTDVAGIAVDRQGSVWSATNAGVVELKAGSKKVVVFDKKDGLQSLDGLYSIIADNSGNILFGGRGCVYRIDMMGARKNIRPPEVLITDLKVFDKDYDLGSGQTIHLHYNQNYFSFAYVALNYTHPMLNRYAYKMDGLDKKWNDAGSRRYVSYANLDEGTYVFNVKACNNEGVWNNTPAKLIIVITPPFWHRWWFYTSAILFFVVVVYSLYSYNINQLKIRLQMRDKIARDLHDDIGSTLSGINIFSKIAIQKIYSDPSGGLELVTKISERSQNTLEALSDIVWSINTRNDGMDNFLMKANEYLSILEVQGIGFDFKVDPELEHIKLGMILRRELYLIFKEAICNAAKYARCSFIRIYLARYKDHCTLTIHDNGRGFNPDNVGSGNGIYNMRQRAQKMNGELIVTSQENEGTLVILNFKITRFR